jgi:[ribosomal protein S18]-alanine N-acetyltransferase
MNVVVERIASSADLDGVVAIENASFNNPTPRGWYEKELERPDVCFVYVVRTDGHPVAGFCAFWLVAEQVHINNLAILPELRCRGLGSLLIEAIIAEAGHLGAEMLTLEVRQSNEAARRLYERAGFFQDGIRKSYYTNPVEDALILSRKTK